MLISTLLQFCPPHLEGKYHFHFLNPIEITSTWVEREVSDPLQEEGREGLGALYESQDGVVTRYFLYGDDPTDYQILLE